MKTPIRKRVTQILKCGLLISVIISGLMTIVGTGGGGGASGDGHIPVGYLLVTVDKSSDGSSVKDASLVVYDDKNTSVLKGTTDNNGEFEYTLRTGSYHIKVAAQGYNPVPIPGQYAIPFEILDNKTTTEIITLDIHPSAGNTGQISISKRVYY